MQKNFNNCNKCFDPAINLKRCRIKCKYPTVRLNLKVVIQSEFTSQYTYVF